MHFQTISNIDNLLEISLTSTVLVPMDSIQLGLFLIFALKT